MRSIEIEISNYRCFHENDPVKIMLRDGFVAFVGVNNSGKSALLRFFYDFRVLFQMLQDRSFFRDILAGAQRESHLPGDWRNLFANQNASDIVISFFFDAPIVNIGVGSYDLMLRIVIDRKDARASGILVDLNGGKRVREDNLQLTEEYYLSAPEFSAQLGEFREFMHRLSRSLYVGPFRNGIFVKSQERYYDMEIGRDFVNTWSMTKTGGTMEQAKRIHDLEHYIKEIFHFDEFIVDANHDKMALQITVNGEVYRLDEVGSGLAQFIVVLTNVVLNAPDFVLIDEPESNLHPSLQVDFVTALGAFAGHGVIFATHNIGLARSASDVIYSLQRNPGGITQVKELERTPRLAEFLGELSFSGYQELGFDGILLVEGKTDIKTFLILLRLYRLDHKMVVLPLGGSDLINGKSEQELLELIRISKNVFAIVDSERTAEGAKISKERQQFKAMCDRIGIECLVLDRTAIENYFSDAAVKMAKGQDYHALPQYGKLRDENPHWAKDENWKIASKLHREELEVTDLGKFLEEIRGHVPG